MELQMKIPTINNKQPTIVKKIDFNTMTHWDYKYEESAVEIKFTNEPNEQNNILWKKEGNEKVVLTLIYDNLKKLRWKFKNPPWLFSISPSCFYNAVTRLRN